LEAAGAAAGLVPPDDVHSGWQYWHDSDGHVHRDYDLPAVLDADSPPRLGRRWYRHGRIHRGGGLPAVHRDGGRVAYWLDGVQYSDGTYSVRQYVSRALFVVAPDGRVRLGQ
jgi:hypothetical protein